MRKKRRSGYKFTEKTQSKRGIIASILGAVSHGIAWYVIWNSFTKGGEGSMYLGSAGIASLLLAFVAFVVAILSLKEEESFKVFPYIGSFLSFTALALWIGIYVAGFIVA